MSGRAIRPNDSSPSALTGIGVDSKAGKSTRTQDLPSNRLGYGPYACTQGPDEA